MISFARFFSPALPAPLPLSVSLTLPFSELHRHFQCSRTVFRTTTTTTTIIFNANAATATRKKAQYHYLYLEYGRIIHSTLILHYAIFIYWMFAPRNFMRLTLGFLTLTFPFLLPFFFLAEVCVRVCARFFVSLFILFQFELLLVRLFENEQYSLKIKHTHIHTHSQRNPYVDINKKIYRLSWGGIGAGEAESEEKSCDYSGKGNKEKPKTENRRSRTREKFSESRERLASWNCPMK